MREWIRLASRLYPRRWRARYGDEFDALLDASGGGVRDFADVLGGALKMQLLNGNSWKLAAGTALAGAILGAGLALAVPQRYISSAVVKVGASDLAAQQLQEVLSRSSLAEMIQRPSLQLYSRERYREPLEDIVEQMRTRDIRVQRSGDTLTISFEYPDAEKAQAVTRALTARLLASDEAYRGLRERRWQAVWPGTVMPPAARVQVLEPPNLAGQPVTKSRVRVFLMGLVGGLVAGLVAAMGRQRPKAARRMAVFAAAGCAAGVAVAHLLPVTYISSAMIRISRPVLPDTPTGSASAAPLAESLLPMEREILSRSNLAALIQRGSLNLYPQLRARKPLQEVIGKMRNEDLRITPVGDSAFRISFAYPDDVKAQLVVRAIITQFVELNVMNMRARVKDLKEDDPLVRLQEYRAGVNLEVLDPASLPQIPAAPNRAVVTALGMLFGMMLGAASLALSARSQRSASPESC
uniref:Lipopolysaccharide biosynthesis n=1 Tax=Solibacter usitatus (strain Ellin6076) TaxID=234267 RepID=Q01X58_SOLUE